MCAPIEPPALFIPQDAAELSAGQIVKMNGDSARIGGLFRSTIREADEISAKMHRPGDVLYGFSGQMGSNILIVRWNATNITWLKRTALADRTVKAAFAQPGGK